MEAFKEKRVTSLRGWEVPLKKKIAVHLTVLAWEIPWTGEPGGVQFMGSQSLRQDLATKTKTNAYIYFSM